MSTASQVRTKITNNLRNATGGTGVITPNLHANVLDGQGDDNIGMLQYIEAQTVEVRNQFTPFPNLQAGWSMPSTAAGHGYSIFRGKMISVSVKLDRTSGTTLDNLVSSAIPEPIRPTYDISLPVSVQQAGGSGAVHANGVLRLLANGQMRVIVPPYPSGGSFSLQVFVNIYYYKW
jgi:hypothetical protein